MRQRDLREESYKSEIAQLKAELETRSVERMDMQKVIGRLSRERDDFATASGEAGGLAHLAFFRWHEPQLSTRSG